MIGITAATASNQGALTSQCADETIARYLITGGTPAPGAPDVVPFA